MNTKINLGAIAVEVKLVKTSSEPKGSTWETKTETVGATDLSAAVNAAALPSPALAAAVPDAPPAEWGEQPFGECEPEPSPADDPLADREPAPVEPEQTDEPIVGLPPATKTLRGVTNDEGEFVDLTEQLAAIDERVKIDGMEIVAAIGANTIARERVRGSQFVQPLDTTSRRACAMLFDALASSGKALAVRWTKRTNQALGIIVASKTHGALVLLEVEFAANMKTAPAKAKLEAVVKELAPAERAAAASLILALEGRKRDLDDVTDERRRLHAELLAAARKGEAGDFEVVTDADPLADDFSAAFAEAQA